MKIAFELKFILQYYLCRTQNIKHPSLKILGTKEYRQKKLNLKYILFTISELFSIIITLLRYTCAHLKKEKKKIIRIKK